MVLGQQEVEDLQRERLTGNRRSQAVRQVAVQRRTSGVQRGQDLVKRKPASNLVVDRRDGFMANSAIGLPRGGEHCACLLDGDARAGWLRPKCSAAWRALASAAS